jgi:hypothetical protein
MPLHRWQEVLELLGSRLLERTFLLIPATMMGQFHAQGSGGIRIAL